MSEEKNLNVFLVMLLALATAMFGWISWDEKLTTSRPAETPGSDSPLLAEQQIPARLWEDPLEAVDAALQQDTSKPTDEQERARHQDLVQQVQRRLTNQSNDRVHLLAVTVPSTPFPNDVEVRLRLRYAVQMALARRRFIPGDRLHLGYVKLPWPTRDQMQQHTIADCTNCVLVVPYEWFVFRDPPEPTVHVLTLWLREQEFVDHPWRRVAWLYATLCPGLSESDRQPTLFIIGPRSSNTLKEFAAISSNAPITNFHATASALGVRTDQARCVQATSDLGARLARRVCIYSPQATAPDPLLGFVDPTHFGQSRKELALKIRNALGRGEDFEYFRNFIAPDDELMDLIAQELTLRHVNVGGASRNRSDRVLLLAEADTEYGRALALSFQAAWSVAAEDHHPTNRLREIRCKLADGSLNRMNAPNVETVSYLVGLDGKKGHQGKPDGNDEKRTSSAEAFVAAAFARVAEQPVGESQLDYAERVARLIEDQNKAYRDSGMGRFKAVGILGGDVYDKLILLQAVRRRLPGAVFFTTDLDARLWHPAHLPFTHNLLVASARDVKVKATEEHGSPDGAPFRDVYQAAVFEACLAALDQSRSPPKPLPPETAPPPRMFEIGRYGPVELTKRDPPDATTPGATAPWLLAARGVLEETAKSAWSRIRRLIGMAVVVLLLASASLWVLRDWLTDGVGKWRVRAGGHGFGWFAFAGSSVLLLLLLALTGAISARLPCGEPWAWTAGVSVWPTELMRLAALLLAVWLLRVAWLRHVANRQELFDAFIIDQTPDTNGEEPKHLANLASFVEWVRHHQHGEWRKTWRFERVAGKQIIAHTLFAEWVAKSMLGARYQRVLPMALLYVAGGCGLMLLTDGMPIESPQRGDFALWTDRALLLSLILAFSVVLWYALDTVMVSAGMLHRLADAGTVWSKQCVTKHLGSLGANLSARPGVPPEGPRREDELGGIEGYLDVQFAAKHTKETARLIFVPFIIQALILLSRSSLFDNWSWPPVLVLIFILSAASALAGSVVLRRAAAKVRKAAEEGIEKSLLDAKVQQHNAGGPAGEQQTQTTTQQQGTVRVWNAKQRVEVFTRMKERIRAEHGGAYGRFFQDPALVAILLPTGVFGMLQVLVRYLFGSG